jgi:hypothetical protein
MLVAPIPWDVQNAQKRNLHGMEGHLCHVLIYLNCWFLHPVARVFDSQINRHTQRNCIMLFTI